MRSPTLAKGQLIDALSLQQSRVPVISLDAARLVVNSILLFALPAEFLLYGPGPRPHRGIFDCDGVVEGGRACPCPAFDHMQVLARATIIVLRTEVRNVDHERIALPAAARVAVPLADAGRQVRP